VKYNDDIIEAFIRENRDKFSVYLPSEGHMEKFLSRINLGIRHIISIVPYLIRVAICMVIIFMASIIIWNNYIRKDRNEITLRNKLSVIIERIKTS
jgi:hypothetical protein